MKVIPLEYKEVNYKDYIKRPANDSDYDNLINEDCMLTDTSGKILGVYITIPDEKTKLLREVVKRIHYQTNRRTQGLTTTSRIFGYMPRETIRKDYCSSTALARQSPKEHAVIAGFATTLSEYYQKTCPEMYAKHAAEVEANIKPEWKIQGTPFTSGIINKDNQLNYHFDRGNIKKVYSNMLAFKKHCKGGYLCMPEYRIALEIADNSCTFFDGQEILHGVTPFELIDQGGYRYTLVYYSLQQMWKCEEINAEIARFRTRKTEREKTRVKRMRGELEFDVLKDIPKEKSKNYKIFKELNIPIEFIGTPFTRLPKEYQKRLNEYKR